MPLSPTLVGSLAPDFALPCTTVPTHPERSASLADYRGRWLMLVFYPRDFSLVCPTELTALSARLEELQSRGCELLGVSTDSVETHQKWIATPRSQGGLGGLGFPLASDLDGSAARAYGVYLAAQKMALRGLFIIDPNGVLQYAVVHNASVGRRSDEVLRVLDGLQSGGLCPENWTAEMPTLDPTRSLAPGSVLAHYRIDQKLGSGSFATVYKAHDLTLERPVAVKVVQRGKVSNPAAVLAEARSAAALQHPNICTIYSIDDSEGVPLIVMEYVPGWPLTEVVKDRPLAREVCARIGRQIADGMAAAHAVGLVHGDLKPENILLADDGTVKITDFGLSRRDQQNPAASETVTWDGDGGGGVAGTPAYMAPELLDGQRATPASDVFALGLVLTEMLTSKKVFAATSVLEVFGLIRAMDPDQIVRELPPRLAALIRRTLAADAGARPSMVEIATGLAAV
jgi:alkyl hydroperoxide reductase subunit AhpC